MSISKAQVLERLQSELLYSRVIENSLRGYVCEAMIAEALGESAHLVSNGWHPWDIQIGPSNAEFPKRIRIQVKNSAALQTWQTNSTERTDCQFVLSYRNRPQYFERDNPGVPCEERGFLCDLYALCHHPISDIKEADQTAPEQWKVFLVPTNPKLEAISAREFSALQNSGPKGSSLIRKPRSMEAGIRGRRPIHPIPADLLSMDDVLTSLELSNP